MKRSPTASSPRSRRVPGEFKLPWHRPAGSLTRPSNIQSKKAYRGINVVTLWVEAQLKGYEVPIWGTYKQFQEAGCQVRRGERASMIVFYKEISFERDAGEVKDGEDANGSAWLARGYSVFNVAQVDGYPMPERPVIVPVERDEAVERFIGAMKVPIRWGGHAAYYSPSEDVIQMPDAGLFTGTETSSAREAMLATLLHEGIHATGHKARLDRDFTARFSTQARAREELCRLILTVWLWIIWTVRGRSAAGLLSVAKHFVGAIHRFAERLGDELSGRSDGRERGHPFHDHVAGTAGVACRGRCCVRRLEPAQASAEHPARRHDVRREARSVPC